MIRESFERKITGELVAIGIEPMVAERHVQQFWTGTGYSVPELQEKWQQHCQTCAIPDSCEDCPHPEEGWDGYCDREPAQGGNHVLVHRTH